MLTNFWFAIITILLAGYLVLDGFDFGIGMLMSMRGHTPEAEKQRRVLLNTIGPVWDGNEVWIITGIGGMFAAFPMWYTTLLSSYYIPFMIVLIGLITRVVSIEWRGKIESKRWRYWADFGIAFGSWVPAFFWGELFSAILVGTPESAVHSLTDSLQTLFRPYAILGGLTTLTILLLHGTVFATLKTTGEFEKQLDSLKTNFYAMATVCLVIFLVWTFAAYDFYSDTGKYLSLVALAIMVIFWPAVFVTLRIDKELLAFISTALSVIGLVILLICHNYPVLIAHPEDIASSVTVDNASSSHYTLVVMTWVVLLVFPMVLAYQSWSYWVFKQRISVESIPASIGLPPKMPEGELRSLFSFLGNDLRKKHAVEEYSDG